ncbi:hypothetical protein P691DRAFT_781995 [Macrolepiota fuliginosa MF-IS2]|uniref:Uncharacterized protein n=1 Tax=Macrolepiota fuliginosa MF-IS2 TaxID=1400762 RepID=A0A9P5XAH2_9AGAR|nr:hypothetical protein P691DRAFT_781995 [Macrolepiota fuliginosa MF-IS2]
MVQAYRVRSVETEGMVHSLGYQSRLQNLIPVARVDVKGKTVVVVDADTGLGFEVAQYLGSLNLKGVGNRTFTRMGAGRLVLRMPSKRGLKQATGYPEDERQALVSRPR